MRIAKILLCLTVATLASAANSAHAAYLFEIDTDGQDDGVLTYHPGFSYGGDTTTASQSATSSAYGTTGGDSIFGGDGTQQPDTYQYRYVPGGDADNLFPSFGQDLGDGNMATGIVGGGPATYVVYAAWPFTDNVSGGSTLYEVTTPGDSFSVEINQNGDSGYGDVWVRLGEIDYTSDAILVTQSPTVANSFVSQRAYGLLFEVVPEPSTLVLMGLGAVTLLRRRTK